MKIVVSTHEYRELELRGVRKSHPYFYVLYSARGIMADEFIQYHLRIYLDRRGIY